MTAIARPRFRTDLVAEPIDDDGKRFIDVVDPDSGNGFRFFEVEYSIACAMDGERDVAGIQRWAREELGVEPSAVEVATVISTLGELGYLDLGYLEGTGATAAPVVDDEPELVAGVVAAAPALAPRAVEDVELGTAGAYSARAADELPASDDMELGSAGGIATQAAARTATLDGPELGPSGARVNEFDAPTPPPAAMPTATLRPVSIARADAEEDGPTNLPRPRSMEDDDEVSVDLSDHLAVSAHDVKEAVRASKVMAAVEVPKDVLAELEANEAKAREDAMAAQAAREAADREAVAREAAARDEAAREAAAREQAEREAAAREAAAAAAAREAQAQAAREQAAREQSGRAVSELPPVPVGVSKKKPDLGKEPVKPAAATPVEQPAGGTSKALVFLLVLVILLAGAFVVWTKVLKKPLPWEKQDEAAKTATPTNPTPTVPTPTPTPPPPPPKPVAPLTEKAGDVSNVVAGQVGVVATVVADGTAVTVGETLLRFAASSADEKKMSGFDNDLDVRYPKQLKDATAAKAKAEAGGNAGAVKTADAKIAEIQKKIDARSAERDELRAKLDGLTIKAPIAGVVKLDAKVAKGARTTADQSVATVTGPASLTATFTIPSGGKTYTQDASVMVAAGDQKANCTATSVDGPTIIVTCPTDTVIAPGTSITLE